MKSIVICIISIFLFSVFSYCQDNDYLNSLTGNQKTKYLKRKKEEQEILTKNWPESHDYDSLSIGYFLNPHFKNHCNTCGFPKNINSEGDYIPSDFLEDFEKDEIGLQIAGGEGILLYLYTEDEKNDISNLQEIKITRTIKGLPKFEFSDLTDDYANIDYISKTCTGLYSAKADASTELNTPIFVVNAAIAAEADSKKKGSIVAMYGQFLSPIDKYRNECSIYGYAINSSIWSRYSKKVDEIDNLYYLEFFKGVLINRFSEKKNSSSFKGDIKAGFEQVVQINAESSAQKEYQNLFYSKDWWAIGVSSSLTNDKYFTPAPTVDEIIAFFKSASIEGFSDSPMVLGVSHSVTFEIPGLHSDLSNNNSWEIVKWDTDVYNDVPSISITKMENGCQIIISGVPKDDFINQNNYSKKLNFELKCTKDVNSKFITIYPYVNVNTNNSPVILIDEYYRNYKLEASSINQGKLKWEINFIMNDDKNPINYDHNTDLIDITLSDIKNTNIQTQILDVSKKISLTSKENKKYTLTLTTQQEYNYSDFDESSEKLKYTGNCLISFPLIDSNGETSGFANKTININIYFPSQKNSSTENQSIIDE